MYAIVDISGKQFRVSKDDKILAPKLPAEVGTDVSLDRVLLISDQGEVTVGQPFIEGALVSARVIGFERGKRVIVFKKKRRKGYQVTRGHRQDYTALEISTITPTGATSKKAKPAKETEAKSTETKKAASSKTGGKPAESKKTATKVAPTRKTAKTKASEPQKTETSTVQAESKDAKAKAPVKKTPARKTTAKKTEDKTDGS